MSKAEYAVVVNLGGLPKAVVPFVGSRLELYEFLMNWYLDTDELTPGGYPQYVYEVDIAGTDGLGVPLPDKALVDVECWLTHADWIMRKVRHDHNQAEPLLEAMEFKR